MNAYFRRWNGSYISRAAVTGKKLMTFLSNCTGIAALFCAVAFEAAKRLYALYLTRFATFDTLVSNANIVAFVLFLVWIYYMALVFLLGGEIAETYDLIRLRRRQRVGLV